MEKAPKTEWTVQVTSRAPTSAVEDVFRRATGVVGERGEAGISFVPCDITEREQVVETCRDADVVVNLVERIYVRSVTSTLSSPTYQ